MTARPFVGPFTLDNKKDVAQWPIMTAGGRVLDSECLDALLQLQHTPTIAWRGR